ncbi:MAG: PLP-dependent aminotransferase family protein, partial [Actinomycetia bacterium]|nr:PLP-dependent aminotransferase family protein [Actinomycetes bacterium]
VGKGALGRAPRLRAVGGRADGLGVWGGRVVAARHLRVERGVVERRPSSGSYVRSAPVTAAPPSTPGDQRLVDFWMNNESAIDLAISSPVEPPLDLLAANPLTHDTLLGSAVAHGYSAYGEPAMRRAAAERLTRQGFASSADDVIITCGAQQGLQLSLRALVRPGDRVFVDSPAYPGLLAVLRQLDAVPIPVRCDAEGIVPRDLARAVGEFGPALVSTCSIGSNPTGALLTTKRRAELLDVIVQHDLVVLEDLTLVDTVLVDTVLDDTVLEDTVLEDTVLDPPATGPSRVAAPLTSDGRVRGVAVGSASKLFWGGLRVGWVRTNESWLHTIAQGKALADFGTSPVTQGVTAGLLRQLHTDSRWHEKRRTELRERRDLVIDLLHEHLPTWGVTAPAAGLSLWIRLPGTDGTQFAAVADRYGVHVMPGEQCGINGAYTDYVRICYDRDAALLREAVKRLALAYAEVGRLHARPPITVGP